MSTVHWQINKGHRNIVCHVTLEFVTVYLYPIVSGGKNHTWSKYCLNISVPYKLTPNNAPVITTTTICKNKKWTQCQ